MSRTEILALKSIPVLMIICVIIALLQPPEDVAASHKPAVNALAYSLSPPYFRTRQAAALADVYNISEADIAKPVNIWGER